MNEYKEAWHLLKKRLEEKTSWGRNELKQLMAEVLEKVIDDRGFPG